MNGRKWSKRELATLRRLYPNHTAATVAQRVGHSVQSTYRYARLLGLSKSPAFLASAASGRLRPGDLRGLNGRFKRGHLSWNKGTHWTSGGRSAQTRFKKGQKPFNYAPVGATRLSKDGILQRKVSETGYPPRDWKAEHALVWEAANGAIPAGHIVVFRDHDRQNIRIENLELVSRRELMRRNSYHARYPKEIGLAIQLRGALVRQINKRERDAKRN